MVDAPIELGKNVIENPNDLTSWILIAVVIVYGIIQYKFNIKVGKTLEKFKGDLAKSEIKFTRHTEMQIETLKKLYDLIVKIHFSLTELRTPMDRTHHALHKNMKTFQAVSYETIIYVHRNKILLTDNIMDQFRVANNKYKKIEKLCISESEALVAIEDLHRSYDPQVLYGIQEKENEYISSRLKILNENYDVTTFEDDILKLRELIENYFKQLVG